VVDAVATPLAYVIAIGKLATPSTLKLMVPVMGAGVEAGVTVAVMVTVWPYWGLPLGD
jgi:hypothetical protein